MSKKARITDRKRFEAVWWALHGPDCYEQDGKVWFKRSRMWGPNGYFQPCVHYDWLDYQRGFLGFGANARRIGKALKKVRLPLQTGTEQ
jgi:hypothetical protein